MIFAIDIDRTIAGGFRAYIEHHNRDLALGISQQAIDRLANYQEFLQLPEVIVYRQHNEARFQASKESIRISPGVILSLEAMPGAMEGVNMLSELGVIRYYTIRANEVREATMQWLAEKHFPHSRNVIFCESSIDKIVKLCQQEIDDTIVLIDDKYDVLLKAFDHCMQHIPAVADALRECLLIAAFGIEAYDLPKRDDIKLLALPSWKRIADLVTAIDLTRKQGEKRWRRPL